MWVDVVVAVNEIDVLPCGGIHARISGGRESTVMLMMENLEGNGALVISDKPFNLLHAVVGAAVIDDDALDVGVGLRSHRLQALLHVVGDVIDGDDDGGHVE